MALGNILIVAGILLFLAVIFAFGVVSLLQCCFNACYISRAQQAAAASHSQGALWRHGLGDGATVGGGDPEMLPRSLAATVYHPDKEDVDDTVECLVCLAELEDGEVARFLPCCNRGFHAQCVDTWLASQSTCPLCWSSIAGMAPVRALALPLIPPA